MGEVYRAHDRRLNRDVAIKVSHAEFSERFAGEARSIAALNHPNICTLYDVGPNYLVMEYIEGEAPKGPLPLDDALRIALQVAEALEAAHEKNIVHRDLKPANIKIKSDGAVKVLDFGLAKQSRDREGTDPGNSPTLTIGATEAGMILGTAAYMSPEQARGKTVDKRADIWAFGVVLYEMITGRKPFEGEDLGETLAAVIKDEPRWDDIPAKVRRLLGSCLEKDPKKRLRDIGDASRLLEDAPLPTIAPVPVEGGLVRLFPWAVAAVAVLALVFVSYRRSTAEPPRVLKMSVLPPERAVLPVDGIPAVSPDGRQVAFAAAVDGKASLWVRDLGALEARMLPGTEGASLPFWSPDSRSLGFFANGKLKRTDVAGGPVLTLCDSPSGRGGTWNRSDVIVFAPGILTPLSRVPAAGGTPIPVTTINAQEPGHRFPWFLPDGRHFLYTAYGLGREKDTVYVADIESKSRRALVPAASNVVYAGQGYLLFLKELTLMAQPFDAGKLQTTGDPVPIAERISYNGLDIRASFSGSQDGVLVYGSSSTLGLSQLTWFDRSGKMTGTLGALGSYDHPAISPDGNSVAFESRDPQTGLADVWRYDLARRTNSRFTFNSRDNRGAIWSPDNSRIAFFSSPGGTGGVFQRAASGAGQDEILYQPAGVPADWSKDGRYIIWATTNGANFGNNVWVLPLFGDRKPFPYLRTNSNERQPKLSPNGQWLAYVSDESKRSEIYVQTFPTPGGKWQISTNGGSIPVWSRDGKELFYISADGKMMAVEVNTGPKFEAGTAKPLFDTHLAGSGYDVSKDGRFLIPTQVEQSATAPITVVVNWNAALKK